MFLQRNELPAGTELVPLCVHVSSMSHVNILRCFTSVDVSVRRITFASCDAAPSAGSYVECFRRSVR